MNVKLEQVEQERVEDNASTNMDLNDLDRLDEYKKILTQLRNKENSKVQRENTQLNSERKLEEYGRKLIDQINNYREFWISGQINMVTILDEFGNDKYKIDKKRGKVNYHMITLVYDAAYVGSYFDVLSWWKANDVLYPELAVLLALFWENQHITVSKKGFLVGVVTKIPILRKD